MPEPRKQKRSCPPPPPRPRIATGTRGRCPRAGNERGCRGGRGRSAPFRVCCPRSQGAPGIGTAGCGHFSGPAERDGPRLFPPGRAPPGPAGALPGAAEAASARRPWARAGGYRRGRGPAPVPRPLRDRRRAGALAARGRLPSPERRDLEPGSEVRQRAVHQSRSVLSPPG